VHLENGVPLFSKFLGQIWPEDIEVGIAAGEDIKLRSKLFAPRN